MLRSSKGIQCSDPAVVRSGSVAVLVMGILVVVHYILLARGAVFHFAARILDVAMDDGGVWSAEMFMSACLIAGGAAVVIGAMGLIASHFESRPGQCCSFSGKATLMVFFFAMWLCNANMQTFVEPVVQQQADEICSLNFYQMYRRAIGCNETRLWTPYDEKLECKEECQGRLETIRRMGGCQYLELMCQDHEFQSVQEGYCLMSVKNGTLTSETHPPMIASLKNQTSVSWECCREACDELVSCAGFSFIEDARQCFLVAPARPASVQGCKDIRWSHDISPDAKVFKGGLPKITGTDGKEGVHCFRKGKSRVLEVLAQKAALTSAVNVVMAVTLLCSTICSCCFQYTLATRRQGKKGAAALVMKMLCPCMQPGRKDPKRNWLALDDVVSNPSTADSDSA